MACIRKRRGKWVLDYYDQFGKRHWETCETKKEAEQRLARILVEIGKGTYNPEKRTKTFKEVAETWYEMIVVPNKRPKTVRYYRNHLDNHLLPFFGDIKINRINVSLIEKYMAKRLSEGVSKATINKTITTLGTVMRYAVKHGLIDRNPVSYVQRLSRSREEVDEKRYLTPEEIRLLISNAKEEHRPLLMTAILTGMREGEILGLKWGDIDWRNRQICVRRTLQNGRFYEPKTKASRRRIDMAPQLVLELKKWKLRCPKSKYDLVFPAKNGNPMDARNMLRDIFYPALRRSGLPRIRFHDLRHTYASLLIKQGEHPKYIQQQMGHSSIKVTLDTYGHLMEATNYEAAKKLGEIIFGSKMVAGKDKHQKNLARLEGFEPPTRGLEVRCSVLLSYRRLF